MPHSGTSHGLAVSLFHPLKLECEAQHQRSVPRIAMTQECEMPVVETGAHAEPVAFVVEADQRHQHQVEPAGRVALGGQAPRDRPARVRSACAGGAGW